MVEAIYMKAEGRLLNKMSDGFFWDRTGHHSVSFHSRFVTSYRYFTGDNYLLLNW